MPLLGQLALELVHAERPCGVCKYTKGKTSFEKVSLHGKILAGVPVSRAGDRSA